MNSHLSVRKNFMSTDNKLGVEKKANKATHENDRLMQEINLLRLEGCLFCFNKNKVTQRRGRLTFKELTERPVTIVLTDFGQPSFTTYRAFNTILMRLTEQGCTMTDVGRCLHNGTITFESARELARLGGYSGFGDKNSKLLFQALMQLRFTGIICSWYNKQTKEFETQTLNVLSDALFAGNGDKLTSCVLTVDSRIIESLNHRHFTIFNIHRLNGLDGIGLVLYKRLFFHFANLYNPEKVAKADLKVWKAYRPMCEEWFGGLIPQKTVSQILDNQLGRHFEEMKARKLISGNPIIDRMKNGDFKITFFAGDGFFADYELFYKDRATGQTQSSSCSTLPSMQTAYEQVGFFHQQLGRDRRYFQDSEIAYAQELLSELTEAEVRNFTCYAIERAKKTRFPMEWFSAIRLYRKAWQDEQTRRATREARRLSAAACSYCNDAGQLVLRAPSGGVKPIRCPHDLAAIEAMEQESGMVRQ
jgi:hypothetical protein